MRNPKNRLAVGVILLLSICVNATGCAICCSPFNADYLTLGGKHERLDPTHGRVGSALSEGYLGHSSEVYYVDDFGTVVEPEYLESYGTPMEILPEIIDESAAPDRIDAIPQPLPDSNS